MVLSLAFCFFNSFPPKRKNSTRPRPKKSDVMSPNLSLTHNLWYMFFVRASYVLQLGFGSLLDKDPQILAQDLARRRLGDRFNEADTST